MLNDVTPPGRIDRCGDQAMRGATQFVADVVNGILVLASQVIAGMDLPLNLILDRELQQEVKAHQYDRHADEKPQHDHERASPATMCPIDIAPDSAMWRSLGSACGTRPTK